MNTTLRSTPSLRRLALALAFGATAFAPSLRAAPIDDTIVAIQQEWAAIKYQVPAKQQETRYAELAAKARTASKTWPDRAEVLIWEGIVVSSLAGAKGGLGALGLAKDAKALYEDALRIAPDALDGSAYNSLGVLYYKVPGWPIGFGDKAKAQELLQKALAINPRGIDPNYFYAEYLVETGKPSEAMGYLEKALKAPARPGREVADAGRRDEAQALLEKARAAAR
jgi:tetratricopeptide (TPR) repeat protein